MAQIQASDPVRPPGRVIEPAPRGPRRRGGRERRRAPEAPEEEPEDESEAPDAPPPERNKGRLVDELA